jgi:hypothetical protein
MTKKPRAPVQNYIDNAKFYAEICKYKISCLEAKKEGKESPRITPYLGECLYNIAHRLSRLPKFVNYQFKEDMIADGLEKCVTYFDRFDHEKYSNPFAYFTQIVYFAFLARINFEKKQLYIKQKTLENLYFGGMLAEQNKNDTDKNINVDLDNDYMNNLVSSYEKKQAEKKEKNKNKKTKVGIENFYETEEDALSGDNK